MAEVLPCSFDGCEQDAVRVVVTVLGPEVFCRHHAQQIEHIEFDWDRAEREWLEQA